MFFQPNFAVFAIFLILFFWKKIIFWAKVDKIRAVFEKVHNYLTQLQAILRQDQLLVSVLQLLQKFQPLLPKNEILKFLKPPKIAVKISEISCYSNFT